MSSRLIMTAISLLLALQVTAQSVSDRQLILEKSFTDKLITEKAPDGANCAEKLLHEIYNQLTGRDFYRPANYMFFRAAVKEAGLFPALLAMPDRILRDSKIGTADVWMDKDQPFVFEGPEAYVPWRARRK